MGDHADDIIFAGIDAGYGYPYLTQRQRRRQKLYPKKHTHCKHCGTANLKWQQVKGGVWRLHTRQGVLHECLSQTAAASDFPLLDDET